MAKTQDLPKGQANPEPTSEELIHSLMTEVKRKENRQSFPELEPVEKIAPSRSEKAHAAPKPRARSSRGRRSPTPSLRDRVMGYRPTRKHILWGALALVVVLRPWLIVGIVFVSFWIVLIAYLTLGHDRMIEILSGAWARFSARWPARADTLRRRADTFALKFDALLERLPESWAEKLALPDLSKPAEQGRSLDDLPDPFEKLKMPEVYRG